MYHFLLTELPVFGVSEGLYNMHRILPMKYGQLYLLLAVSLSGVRRLPSASWKLRSQNNGLWWDWHS